jgi:hypothetical protein
MRRKKYHWKMFSFEIKQAQEIKQEFGTPL